MVIINQDTRKEETLAWGEHGFALGPIVLELSPPKSGLVLQEWWELRKEVESTVYKLGFIIPACSAGLCEWINSLEKLWSCRRNKELSCDSNEKYFLYAHSEGPGWCPDGVTHDGIIINLAGTFQVSVPDVCVHCTTPACFFCPYYFTESMPESYGESWLGLDPLPVMGNCFPLRPHFLVKASVTLKASLKYYCFFPWLSCLQIRDNMPPRQWSCLCLCSPCGHLPTNSPEMETSQKRRVLHNQDQMYDVFLN